MQNIFTIIHRVNIYLSCRLVSKFPTLHLFYSIKFQLKFFHWFQHPEKKGFIYWIKYILIQCLERSLKIEENPQNVHRIVQLIDNLFRVACWCTNLHGSPEFMDQVEQWGVHESQDCSLKIPSQLTLQVTDKILLTANATKKILFYNSTRWS